MTPRNGAILAIALSAGLTLALVLFHGDRAGALTDRHDHVHGEATTDMAPREAGQSAFAAIAEIVAMLDSRPDTDWSRVSIATLRDHLVDMDRLMLDTDAEVTLTETAATFAVRGTGAALRAIHTMVPAHARELDRIEGWKVSATASPEGATLRISVADRRQLTRIKGLGFYGLMALGAHHQPHHLAMATGVMTNH